MTQNNYRHNQPTDTPNNFANPFKPIFFTSPNENKIATNKPALATKNYTYNNVVNRRV
jgi:hypothetical protein